MRAGRIRADANVINVFLVLTAVRIEVERGRVSDVPTSLIGNDGNVIAYLILVRIAFLRVKRVAHRDVRRPGHTRVGAIGIK